MGDENLQNDINAIKNNLSAFGMKLSLVYDALVGNQISKDGGLIQDINNMKEETKELSKRIVLVENGQTKKQLYINIIYGAVGIIITLILKSLIK